MATKSSGFDSLASRTPETTTPQLLAQLRPPREFANATFESYHPDASHPSQAAGLEQCRAFATAKPVRGRAQGYAGIYLDGGFGVGKTHLLAAIWHAFKGKKVYGSFLAFTGLIGVLGFQNALQQLGKFELICIDEFELDDPGDTMMLSRLLSELSAKGVRFAATSNTPPNALGQGRFAAADFAREINAMADRFQVVTIDGEDYRHRPIDAHSSVLNSIELVEWLDQQQLSGRGVAEDVFLDLLKHLASLHPSHYVNLLHGIDALGIRDVAKIYDQVSALRFVALVDRMYEAQIAIRNTGWPLTDIFAEDMIGGAYRKKYLRAISRLGALTTLD